MTRLTPDQIAALQAPLNRDNVKGRKQAGREVSYIESWFAESEANRIFGYDGWDSTIKDLRLVSEREVTIGKGSSYEKPGWSVSYVCTVRVDVCIDGAFVTREGVGAGHGIDADPGQAHESAVKEAASDAEKRALKTWGNQFGLALYDKTQANVATAQEIASKGRKTPAQAKRDGDHEKYMTEFAKLDQAGVIDWLTNFDSYTADAPVQWLDALRDRLTDRENELKRPPESLDAEADLDEGFRGAVGPASASGMAGSDRQVAAA